MRPSIPRNTALSLALGLATSIAVAWAIALRDPHAVLVCSGASTPQPCALTRLSAPGCHTEALLRGLTNDPLALDPPVGRYASFTFLGGVSWSGSSAVHHGFLLVGGDRHADPRYLSPTLPPDTDAVAFRAAGWPLHCLKSVLTRDAAGAWSSRGLIPIARDQTLFGRSLPLAPIWTGLAADSLLWAVPWAAILIGPTLLRRFLVPARRRRRWRCRHCRYDLHGATGPVCPECGRAIPHRFCVRPPPTTSSRRKPP